MIGGRRLREEFYKEREEEAQSSGQRWGDGGVAGK
jgi:hypothetical protein